MKKTEKLFFSVWINSLDRSEEELHKIFSRLSESGIREVLSGGSVVSTEEALNIVEKYGIKLHHWQMMLINNSPNLLLEHKDWYTVNRLGENSANQPVYVDYYRWLCPNHPKVLPYLEKLVRSYCQLDKLEGFHFDYIRYADVILPQWCQKQYGLIQEKEEAQYDYCYCPHCQSIFKKEYGYEILELSNPEEDENWRKFRWDSITRLVQKLAEIVKSYNKLVSAAVFPTPEIARNLVRQNWSDWELDSFYPMLYHDFYEEKIDWIRGALVSARRETDKPLQGGLYLPRYTAEGLEEAIEVLFQEDVEGICLFDYRALDDDKLRVIKKMSERNRQC